MTFVASAGDTGFFNSHQVNSVNQIGVGWPASDPNVLSVGGTTLYTTANGTTLAKPPGTSITMHPQGAGGAAAAASAASTPSRLTRTACRTPGVRTVPDVAYDADVNLDVWVYDSLDGWEPVGGTSAGAPQWAGLIAEIDQGRALVGLNPLDGPSQTLPGIYEFSSAFRDVTSGSNGYPATRVTTWRPVWARQSPPWLAGDLAFHITSDYISAARRLPGLSQSLPAGRSIQCRVDATPVRGRDRRCTPGPGLTPRSTP